MRILLAEDDLLLGDGIRAGLRLEGDTVEWVTDGVAAENALVTDEFDLLVLDIAMQGQSGMELAHELRRRRDRVSIVFVTGCEEYLEEG